MHYDNPFVLVARKSIEEGLDYDQTMPLLLQHLANVDLMPALTHALEYAFTLRDEPLLIDRIASTCLMAPEVDSDAMLRAKIHLRTGIVFQERFDSGSLHLAIRHFDCVRRFAPPTDPMSITSHIKQAVVFNKLVEAGFVPVDTLQLALQHAMEGSSRTLPGSLEQAEALMVSGTTMSQLAIIGINPAGNTERAIRLLNTSRTIYDMYDPKGRNGGVVRVQEAVVRVNAARFLDEPIIEFRIAAQLFRTARQKFGENDPESAGLLSNEAGVLVTLSALGVNSASNAKKAISLCKEAREKFDPLAGDHRMLQGRCYANEAAAHLSLSIVGINQRANGQAAVEMCSEAQLWLENASPDYALNCKLKARAHLLLAAITPLPNNCCELAIECSQDAMIVLDPSSIDAFETMALQAEALKQLALEAPTNSIVSRLENCQAVVINAENEMLGHGLPIGHLKLLRADIHLSMGILLSTIAQPAPGAGLRQEAIGHFYQAIKLSNQVHRLESSLVATRKSACLTEGFSRLHLAEISIEIQSNATEATRLFHRARQEQESGGNSWFQATIGAARCAFVLDKFLVANDYVMELADQIEEIRLESTSAQARDQFIESQAEALEIGVKVKVALANSENGLKRQHLLEQAWEFVWRLKGRTLLDRVDFNEITPSAMHRSLWIRHDRLRGRLCELELRKENLVKQLNQELSEHATKTNDRLIEINSRISRRRHQYQSLHTELLQESNALKQLCGASGVRFQDVFSCVTGLTVQDAVKPSISMPYLDRRVLVLEFVLTDLHDLFVFLKPLFLTSPIIEVIQIKRNVLELMLPLAKLTQVSSVTESQNSYEIVSDSLSGLACLVEPWGHLIDEWNPNTIVVSGHSFISRLPLHALCWKEKPLIEYCSVSYLNPLTVAPQLATPAAVNRRAVLLGNPAGDLQHADDELDYVGSRLRRHGWNVEEGRGSEATSQFFFEKAPKAEIVHIATHATVVESNFEESGILIGNERISPARLLAELKFEQTPLVFLSACSSSIGSIARADEFQSFIRILYACGASAVIASLWDVDDSTAADFADLFYRELLDSEETPINAFRKAIKQLRELYPNPLYWAPFVLHGNSWRQYSSSHE